MPPNTTVCYVARHGATILNQEKCFRGNANPPLSPVGIKEAHELANFFADKDISHIICSDKQRATATAEIIAKSKHIPIHKLECLRALNVGDFSGEKRTPESEAHLQQYLDSPDTKIPGGESLNEFKARIAPCLQNAVDLFSQCGVPPLLVCHSSIIHETGAVIKGHHKSILVEPGGAIEVFFNGSKLDARPIFKPLRMPPGTAASTIT